MDTADAKVLDELAVEPAVLLRTTDAEEVNAKVADAKVVRGTNAEVDEDKIAKGADVADLVLVAAGIELPVRVVKVSRAENVV